ncbi:MAG: (Fe-S)-binding protein, partial [Lachnospiraceae bacterium]|nr:(Fe-S)-binding protein [Lachnospiraceae bacterium]
MSKIVLAGLGGEKYIPLEERTGNESIVYFTRDLSAAGLQKAYEKVNSNITGKIAVKLHTGEQNGPNIIPRPWIQEFMKKEAPI